MIDKQICEQCGRKSSLISDEQAFGKTFEMTYERENASLSLSCSKLSNNWISVDERYPKDAKYVLCSTPCGYYEIGVWTGHQWLDTSRAIIDTHIMAWMTLPSCPKIPDNCSEIPNGSDKENNNE